MKFFEKYSIKNIVLIIFFISLLTRLIYLLYGMPTLTNDEADLYTTSYTLAKTGTDQYGNKIFLTSGFLTAKPSIPIYISSIPWLFASNKSIILARLPFALLNSLTPLLFFAIILILTKNKRLSLISFCVFNFSPWFSYLSATGYEAYVGLFFVLLSLLILVSNISGIKKLIFYFITSFLAFNSYMGLKPIFPIISVLFLLIEQVHIRKKVSFMTIAKTTAISIVFFIIFLVTNATAPNTTLIKKEYINMISYFNQSETEGKVWFDRLTTDAPEPIKKLITNKFTVRFKDQFTKYMTTYNLAMYFQKGDPSSLYGTADLSGLFFFTDFIFFLFGLIQLYRVKERGIKLLLLLIIIGGIPIALATTSPTFILRGIILMIPFSILISYGIFFFVEKFKKINTGMFLFFTLLCINCVFYFTLYQTRIKILNSEYWHYSDKLLIERVKNLNEKDKIFIFSSEPKELYLQFAFYNITDSKLIKNLIKEDQNRYYYSNITIQKNCSQHLPQTDEMFIYRNLYCKYLQPDPHYTVDEHFAAAGNKSGVDYILIRKNVLN